MEAAPLRGKHFVKLNSSTCVYVPKKDNNVVLMSPL